jgi:hypothetical protein
VLQGDVQVGDIVTVVQRYAFEEGRFDNGDGRNALVTFSGMTPMNKGDKWIYFLGYDETVDAYWTRGDSAGRYPVPNEEIMEIAEEIMANLSDEKKWLESLGESSHRPIDKIGDVRDDEVVVPCGVGNLYAVSTQRSSELYEFSRIRQEIANKLDDHSFRGVLTLGNNKSNLDIYAQILDHFQIEARNWVNPGRSFDAALIELYASQGR